MIRVTVEHVPFHVLSIDSECRPSHFIGNDYLSKEITVMAWRWTDEAPSTIRCMALGECTMREMLREFVTAYDRADVITGHYCRAFDLPLVNAMLVEARMSPLEDKYVQDTKLDFIRWHGLSQSQRNLSGLLGIEQKKQDMDQAMWRAANRLTRRGIALAKSRCTGDVHQQIAMREEMLKRGLLRAPRWWTSTGARLERKYAP